MIRIVTKVISTPHQFGDKWHLIVESRNYGKAPNHILEFDSKEAADQVGIGYEYSTDNIYREPRKAKLNTLSVQQPFALLEVLGIKDIENRTWKTDFRGRIYIHACAWKKARAIYQLTEEQKSIVSNYPIVKSLLDEKELMYSAIIGHVDLVDIVEDSSSVWALKDHYHWILANPVMFESSIVNVKGQLNFWDCSEYVK
ncbi:MAG: hypothetical protein ACK5LF_21455 [Bacteroides xylanisolvens]